MLPDETNNSTGINSLPDEILGQIFIYFATTGGSVDTLHAVCGRWQAVCSDPYIIRRLCSCQYLYAVNIYECGAGDNGFHTCVCETTPHHAAVCQALEHPCICENGPHHAAECGALEHPCICENGPHHAAMCRGVH